jgi:hypothetical protein
MQRSFLDLLILLAASAAIEAYLSGPIRLDDIGPIAIAAGLGLPVVLSYKFEALIVFGIIAVAKIGGWSAPVTTSAITHKVRRPLDLL